MRISDWSSDGGSSDLRRYRGEGQSGGDGGQGRRQGRGQEAESRRQLQRKDRRQPRRIARSRRAEPETGCVEVGEPETKEQQARGRFAARPREISARGWRDVLLRVKGQLAEDNLSVVAACVAFRAD